MLSDNTPSTRTPSVRTPALERGRLLRAAAVLCLAAITALAFVAPSDSLRATLVTMLVVIGLVYAGWRFSEAEDEPLEQVPVDD